MKRISLFLLSLIWGLTLHFDALGFTLSLQEDRLSLQADQVPLQEILEKFIEKGITVKIDPGINPPVTAHFKERDLQKAIGGIVKPLDHILIWTSVDGPVGPISRLSEIQIFESGKRDVIRNLAGVNLAVDKDPKSGVLYVKDEVLLALKKGVSMAAFYKLLEGIQGTVVDSYPQLGIYRIRLNENTDVPAVVKKLGKGESVVKAEPNYVYPLPDPYKNDQSLQPVPDLTDSAGLQEGVPIAVLDTGWKAFYNQAVSIRASWDAFHPEEAITDSLGHGTQMTMMAAGLIEPNGVEIEDRPHNPVIPIRIFDENGNTSNFHLMKSMDFALENGARVISLSWGSETRSDFLEDQINRVTSKGVIVVAAAGNKPTGKPVYPAAYDTVIGVGALGPDGKTWAQSNYGDTVMLYAPGFASFPIGYKGEPGTYAGTSISAAFMAGLFADYLSKHPESTGEEIINALNRK